MSNNQSLRDHFHDLMNKIQGIAVNSRAFAYLYGNYPDNIDSSTKDKLSKVIQDIKLYYNNTLEKLDVTSEAISKSVASKEWGSVKEAIDNELKEICILLDNVKNLNRKISETDYKKDILNIADKMNLFQEKCESIAHITEKFKEKLVLLEIYDNVYN